MTVQLSIIIPTYNSFKYKKGSLELTISSLFKQKAIKNFEVIIVYDGSTDETKSYLETIKDIKCNFDVKVVPKEHDGNRARSRNIGVEKSNGELVLFLDDDVVLLDLFCLKKIVDIWRPRTFMCGAKRYWTQPVWYKNEILKFIRNFNFEGLKNESFVPKGLNRYNGFRDLLEFSFLSNFGLLAREDFIDIGKFDEGYTGWGYEETDLMFRLLQGGIEFINLYSMIEILHLNHPLGRSETILTEENRIRYCKKTHEKGVIFKVNHLFGAFEDDGVDVFLKDNSNSQKHLEKYFSNTKKERKMCLGLRRYKDTLSEGAKNSNVDVIKFGCNRNPHYLNFDISIIITTYNSFEFRKGSIELVLASLKKQDCRNFEVIMVDDGSTDQTKNFILENYTKRSMLPFEFKYVGIVNHTGNRSKCRNIGAAKAKSELLLFLDDDTVFLSTKSLEKIIKLHKPNHFLCGAKRFWSFINWNRNLFLTAIENEDFELIKNKSILPLGINRRKGFRDLFEYSFIANCGLVGKTDFMKIGGFDEVNFDGWGREDVDLMLRLYLNNTNFINLFDYVSILNLNHPLKQGDAEKREFYFERYEESERKRGYIFKVNHLFGVFENDGTDVLIPITNSKNRCSFLRDIFVGFDI